MGEKDKNLFPAGRPGGEGNREGLGKEVFCMLLSPEND